MKKFFTLLALVSFLCLALIACGSEPATSTSSPASINEVAPQTTSQTSVEASIPEAQKTIEVEDSTSSNFQKMYEAGTYKVGTDFEAGPYILLADDGGYFSVSSDANGNDILFNDNFDFNALIEVKDGEFIKLSRCVAVDMEEFYLSNTVSIEQNGGTFRVGFDIQPGEYKLTADSDRGYYCIYEDLRQDAIIANDNFDKSTYVELKEGQYILISRCKFADGDSTSESSNTDGDGQYNKMYEAGTYKVGTDFDAGTYVLLTDEKGYFSVTNDANGDEIVFNDNFTNDAIIEVKEGEYIKFSRCIAVDMEEFYSSETISLDKVGGMLRVGYDLPSGEYKLKAENDRGYYCIYDDLRQSNIVANDNFDNSTYVEVKDGQYLVLSRCSVIQ